MNMLERLNKVFEGVTGKPLDLSLISSDTKLVEDLQFNSINYLYMAIALEDEFKVSFSNDDLNRIKTIGDVINFLEDK